jgi:site-specific recombinase XerD
VKNSLDLPKADNCSRLCRRPRNSYSRCSSAKIPFKAHPHMHRHACGYALANKGHDTRTLQILAGHKNIQHTVRHTELAASRFKDFCR